MAVLFFDSSGLVKRYIAETGTAWVINQLRLSAVNDIFIAGITGIKIASAIARRLRNGSVSQSTADKALRRFKRDFERRFIVVDLTPKIIGQGILLAEKHSLRGYNTTQLAVGLSIKNRLAQSGVQHFIFISADKDLNVAANLEGLIIENPNNYP